MNDEQIAEELIKAARMVMQVAKAIKKTKPSLSQSKDAKERHALNAERVKNNECIKCGETLSGKFTRGLHMRCYKSRTRLIERLGISMLEAESQGYVLPAATTGRKPNE